MRNPLNASIRARARALALLLVLLALGTVSAQQAGVFDAAFEGQLFAVRHELRTAGGPMGVTFINGNLFVSDADNRIVVAFGPDGVQLPLMIEANGMVPNLLSSANVSTVVNGVPTVIQALLVSDLNDTRVRAFDLQANHLFTMRLDWPGTVYTEGARTIVPVINGTAIGPQAQFVFNPSAGTLTLEGSFAAAWAADFGRFPGAVLAYRDASFTFNSGDELFEVAPTAVLTAGGTAREMLGLTFDRFGNLFAVDTVTERLLAFGPDFSPLFIFGTPVPGGTTAEFYEPYGLAYWPDDGPGRLFIADALNNRIVAYRPNLANARLDHLFTIEGITIDGLEAAQPYAVAVDPSTANQQGGRLGVSDSSGLAPVSWILQTRQLAAFDLRVFDANDNPVETICSGAPYSIRFGLTVPAAWPPVQGIMPQLEVDGVSVGPPGVSPIDLDAGQAATYIYQLTAPGNETAPFVGDIPIRASGVAAGVTDVLAREGKVSVSDCFHANLPPTVSTTTNIASQLSGWTAVFRTTPFVITVSATDDSAVREIEYKIEGANDLGFPFPPVPNPNPGSPSQAFEVELPEMGFSTFWYRARDDDFAWSPWQKIDLQLVEVVNFHTFEGQPVSFTVTPISASYSYSAGPLPPGVSFDPLTGVISGTPSFTAHGLYSIAVTESSGDESSSYSFVWKIEDANTSPTVVDDMAVTLEDSAVSINVLANDADGDLDPLTVNTVTQPAASEGTVTIGDEHTVLFTPAANFFGVATFTYTIFDGHGGSATGVVTVTVTPVNDAPQFVAGAGQTVLEDAPPQVVNNWATAIGTGPANESGQAASFVVTNSNPSLFASGPAIAPSGTLTYQPAPNRFGTATVTVRVTDNGGTANGGLDSSAPQTFTIVVEPVNDAPVAAADSYTVTEGGTLAVPAPGVLTNDSDVDSAALVATAASTPPGVLIFSPNGSFTYTPPATFTGPATFTYSVSDGAAAASATVTIVVSPANLPPVCSTATVSPSIIWPVNHKPVGVTIGGISDPEGAPVSIKFTSILQDEPTDSEGQGHTLQDGAIEANGARAWVRAERAATKKAPGDGRVYLVGFTATDAGGLTCTGTVRIGVPHDQRGTPAVLSPGRWNSVTGQKFP